jgi:hypothetical protein
MRHDIVFFNFQIGDVGKGGHRQMSDSRKFQQKIQNNVFCISRGSSHSHPTNARIRLSIAHYALS